jgi:hypothetical protein
VTPSVSTTGEVTFTVDEHERRPRTAVKVTGPALGPTFKLALADPVPPVTPVAWLITAPVGCCAVKVVACPATGTPVLSVAEADTVMVEPATAVEVLTEHDALPVEVAY